MTTVTITGNGLIGVSISSSDGYFPKMEVHNYDNLEESKRRTKMKGDPNELRKKANNKSTRPKWMDRI